MKSKILLLKIELKNLAKEIKVFKARRCEKNSGYVPGLHELRSRYRHMHVVYCLARGRTLEQVDSGNGLDMDYINFQLEAITGEKKLYVVVDNKLPSGVQAAQACHAVAEFMKKYPRNMWNNGTIVVIKDNFNTYHARYKLYQSHDVADWREPDLKNAMTAYAVFGPRAEETLKELPLV